MDAQAPAGFRDRVRQALRQDALDAAYRILADEGWTAVTMAAVARSVGVSRQTLYTVFASRDRLGDALLAREVEKHTVAAFGLFKPGTPLSTALREAIRYMLREGETHPLI